MVRSRKRDKNSFSIWMVVKVVKVDNRIINNNNKNQKIEIYNKKKEYDLKRIKII